MPSIGRVTNMKCICHILCCYCVTVEIDDWIQFERAEHLFIVETTVLPGWTQAVFVVRGIETRLCGCVVTLIGE